METISMNQGVVTHLFEKLITPAAPKFKAKIALVGIGFELHFDWDSILENYAIAKNRLAETFPSDSFELFCADEPVQTKEDMLSWLNAMKKEAVDGIIIYQASYMAGDLAATTARFFQQNQIPLLSWTHDEATGGRLSNNRLCGQNFVLNILSNSNVKYSWIYEAPTSAHLSERLMPFANAVYAKASMNQRVIGMVGGFRVPGFYDCEMNELALLEKYGLLVDRVDFETIWKHGEKFNDEDIAEIKQELLDHPACKYNNVPEDQLMKSIRLALSVADYSRVNNYIGIGLKNWPELFDHYGIAGDGAGALIQDVGIPVADESDMGALLTMVVMNQLTLCEGLPTLMDLSLINQNDNRIGFWHCGGASTKLMREETGFEVRMHSILENYPEGETFGMLVEFLHRLGPVTIAKIQHPNAVKIMTWEGEIEASEMAFRGSYMEVLPEVHQATDILSTVMDNGCDHHWIITRGHRLEDIRELNHWLSIEEMDIPAKGSKISGRSK
ncbi:hypothetical protein [Persicobacter psychrovividus]|uniref:Fucose isomerase n=1 Tax=Persicobacter psychrovividus TaxID=387638 RepID=A0ABN6LGL1_9BACT|nr:fucose isomerase [Persicobacter psychrovividus]